MDKTLTWNEIITLYPNEWVMLINYKYDGTSKIFPSEGQVVAHAKSRKEFSTQMMKIPANDFSVRYTGLITDNRR